MPKRRETKKIAAFGGVIAGAFAIGTALLLLPLLDARIDTDNEAQVSDGRALYAQHCTSCHGANLEGEPNWKQPKPNGRMPAPPHDESGHTWHHPDAQLVELTRKGVSGILPGYESDMPAFENVLTDAQIRAVLAYIKSSWPPEIRARQQAFSQGR
jgi:mono/diheme cytochrome c family protein